MLYFPHIPKCGGTTIKELFYSAVGRDHCIKIWDHRFESDVEADEFADLGSEVIYSKKAIVGHLLFRKMLVNKFAKELYTQNTLNVVTVVRNPIDRILSLFNYVNANEDHPHHKRIKEVDPFQFVLNQPSNIQHKFLQAYGNESVESICNRISIFPIEDSTKLVTEWIANKTGQTARPVRKLNVTADAFPDFIPFKRSALSPSQVATFEQKHQQDYELYEYSRSTYL
jgi:hypothetical protein